MDRLITLTTDFGLTDPSVGICKGVILRIAPEARIVDVSHGVTRQSVLEGAGLLAAALPYFPVGVHLAVVDPGVGTNRRPVAIEVARGDILVGPDNGLLQLAADALGGVTACHELASPAYRLAAVSRTFHGRDIFAPAAAHLALGVPIAAFGPVVDPESLVRLELSGPSVAPGWIEATVVGIDAFGSAQLFATAAEFEQAFGKLAAGTELMLGTRNGQVAAAWSQTYGDVAPGAVALLVDSYGRLLVAVNMGSARDHLALDIGDRLAISRGA